MANIPFSTCKWSSAQIQSTDSPAEPEDMIRQLDRECYLESETYYQILQKMEEDFKNSPVRAAAFAGQAYENDPERLRHQLQTCQASMMAEAPADLFDRKTRSVRALISPHIDLHRGGKCFAYAYQEIAIREPSDLYLIFGTGHQIRNSMMVLTKKAFDTPLGPVETDQVFAHTLLQESPLDLFAEEILHKNEHSIEFQVLWLKYILGDSWKGKIVPILSGSLHPFIQQGVSPRTDSQLAQTLDIIRRMIREYSGKVTVIAGADMSHVGNVSAARLASPTELKRVEQDDLEVIRAIRSGNAEQFFNTIEKNRDCNNVCGLSPVYMTPMDSTGSRNSVEI